MLREECRYGMMVEFEGRRGVMIRGKVIKLNPSTVKVEMTESAGRWQVGAKWNVSYGLLKSLGKDGKPPKPEKLTYNMFDQNNRLLKCLLHVYGCLSPENLTCDGEASRASIRERAAVLNRQKRGLFIAIGKEISEEQIYEWEESRRKRKDGDQS